MLLMAYAFYDSKAQFFQTPFFMAHRGQAVRAVMELVQDMNTTIARHPQDYTLFEVGTFDDQTGRFDGFAPINIGIASSFIQRPEPPRQVDILNEQAEA